MAYLNNKKYYSGIRNEYIHGTAVPKPEYPEERRPVRHKIHRRKAVVQQKVQPIIIVSWIIASLVFIAACGILLTYQMHMNSYAEQISKLETDVADLRAANNFNLSRINESVDLDAIQQEAEALGMVKLTPDKIIEVPYSGADYVKQYKKVSDNKD